MLSPIPVGMAFYKQACHKGENKESMKRSPAGVATIGEGGGYVCRS